jgi:hypothetical protein
MVEHLPTKHKALSSNSSTGEKKKAMGSKCRILIMDFYKTNLYCKRNKDGRQISPHHLSSGKGLLEPEQRLWK